jgi:acetyl-CoA/propionyl-CoA carboxylase biotin carboxyl carrier protein
VTGVFTRVLVANRGEIAVRIIRTLHAMGIDAVAVHSEADARARHVAVADESVLLGPAEARLSYLDVAKVVDAALATGVQAVHPGYGFLAENPDLAEACERSGLVLVGPHSATIRLMGDKRAAKDAVAALGVAVVPGFHDAGADDDRLVDECAAIGFPVIVKPSAGGGGKGMRVVSGPDDVAAALASARREALAAFGDDALLLEKYLPHARHVEVQVLGDGRGDVIHLGTRDCSLQRRHQKVVEEAPAPFLPDDVRERMHADAVAIARSVSYRGVGTVEYVVDADDPTTYYFLEMNTRLQVEHPVTEAVTGLDLVELQLRVAAGEPLPIAQDDVVVSGHAVEARVYAEDGHHGFLPSSGRLLMCDVPAGVRVDSGVRVGDVVGTSYDPLLLKVIAAGDDRQAALDRLDVALRGTAILGVAHNVAALRTLLADADVRTGRMTTSLIGELGLGAHAPEVDPHRLATAALVLASEREIANAGSPWYARPGWRVGDHAAVVTPLVDDHGRESVVRITGSTESCTVQVDDGVVPPASLTREDDHVVATVGDRAQRYAVAVHRAGTETTVWLGSDGDAHAYRVPVRHRISRPGDDGPDGGELRSPMPGSVVALAHEAGDVVREGEVIAVIEAMKMEYPLVSPIDGVLTALHVALGVQVVRDQVIGVVGVEEGSS